MLRLFTFSANLLQSRFYLILVTKTLLALLLVFISSTNLSAQTCCPEFRLKDAVEICPPEGACPGNAGTPDPGHGKALAACRESVHVYTVYPNDPVYTYTWTVVGGVLTSPNPGNPGMITWGNGGSGFIKVVITGLNGCIDSLMHEVCLIAGPKADFIATPDTVCVNTPVFFTNLSTGGSSYYWEFGDGDISDDFQPTHAYTAAGVYTVILTVCDAGSGSAQGGEIARACGCCDTISRKVVVLPGDGPKIETDCCYGTVCPDFTSKFCCPDTCSIYNWTVTGGIIINGAGTNCIEVLWDPTYSVPTTVSLETPGCGPSPCPGKTTINVPVLYPNLPINGPNLLCIGASGNYSLPHMPGTYYTWTVIGGLATFNSPDLNKSNVNITFSTPGTYTVQCTYTNPLSGCNGSSSMLVNVLDVFQLSGLETVCEGEAVFYSTNGLATWNVTPAGAIYSPGPSPSNVIIWNTPGTYVITATHLPAGTFCNADAVKVVEVVALPILSSITGPSFACPNKNFTFGVTSNVSDGQFTWSVSPGTGIIHSLLGEDGDEAIIELTGAGPWTVNVYQQIEISPGKFCQSATQSLVVNPYPLPSISGQATVCVDAIETYTTTGPTPPGGFQWSVSPPNRGSILTGQGTTSVTIRWHGTPTTANVIVTSCSGTDVYPVTIVNPPFVAPISANGPTAYCLPSAPSNLTLSTTAGFPNYQWYQDGVPVGINSPSYTIVSLPAVSATYVFTVAVSNGICDVTKSILIIVDNCPPGTPFPPPPPCSLDFTINPNPACVGQPVTFVAQPSFGGFEFSWDFGDAATSFTQLTEHEYDAPGVYNVTLVGILPNYCTLTIVKPVTVNPLPVCNITAAATYFCPGDSVLLTACASMSAYQWYRDDFLIPGATNPTHYATQHGEYYAVVTNNFGCSDKTNAIYIYIHGLPKAKIKAKKSYCALPGSTEVLTLNAFFNPNYSYFWSDIPAGASFVPNGSNAASSTSATLTLPGTLSYQHQFVLEVTDMTTGCLNYDTICVTFYETPPLMVNWQVGCEGVPYILSATPNDPTKYNYQWSNSATTPVTTVSTSGFYSVTITDKSTGCSASSPAAIIFPKPDVSLFPLGCATIDCKDTLHMYIPLPLTSTSWANTYPAAYPVIQWWDALSNTMVGTGQAFPFNSPGAGTFELYVLVQNHFGCVDSAGIFCVTVTCSNLGDLDFGDAPDALNPPCYPTLLANNGARHNIVPGVYLGSLVDPEPDGQPNINAVGDDLDIFYPSSGDDEDGVILPPSVQPGQSVVAIITASVAGFLDAWIDFNNNCSWADPGDHVLASVPLNAGINDIFIEIPCDAEPGQTYARFRFRTTPGPISYDGLVADGEVEDYTILIEDIPCDEYDFGDAPDSPPVGFFYPTLLVNNGARHLIVPGVYLGALIDAEPDGQPTLPADGDDINGVDDEDGVNFLTTLTQGQSATMNVIASVNGFLDVWIDYNQDGTWLGAGEHVFAIQPLVAGGNLLNFTVPASAVAGNTYARFRFRTSSFSINFDGLVLDGEVEDYMVHIDEFQTGENFEFGDAPEGSLAYLTPLTIGQFPTCTNVGLPFSHIQHFTNPGMFFGPSVDYEPNGNAGFCPLFNPNTYNQDECFLDGDAGLMFPVPFTITGSLGSETIVPCIPESSMPLYTCTNAVWGSTLDIFVNNVNGFNLPAYVNVLVDWNQDGQWGGGTFCFNNPVPEHVLVNFPVPPGYVGPLSALVPPSFLVGPNQGYVWVRFSITESPVGANWNGAGIFDFGETEDYLLFVMEEFVPELFDFGDAPEESLAYITPPTIGQFPTCINVGPAGSYISHAGNHEAYFGQFVDYEPEGNAGWCPTFNPNTYNMDECWMDGDAGLIMPRAHTITGSIGSETIVPCADGPNPIWRTCRMAQWGKNVDIFVTNNLPGQAPAYVNILVDWNQNGLWGGSSMCFNNTTVPEHVLVNFVVPPGFSGPLSALTPPNFRIGPNAGYVWTRFSITENPVATGWTGSGTFGFGETEDYLFRVTQTLIPIDLILHDIFIPYGLDTCFAATDIINTGGSGPFVVEDGGAAHLHAGVMVRMLPGTKVNPGGYLHAKIITDDTYCANHRSLLVEDDGSAPEKIAEQMLMKSSGFKVFPNPTTGAFVLELTEPLENEFIVVEIYSMLGERITSSRFSGSTQYEFNLSNNPRGVYLVRVLNGDVVGIEKVIKN